MKTSATVQEIILVKAFETSDESCEEARMLTVTAGAIEKRRFEELKSITGSPDS